MLQQGVVVTLPETVNRSDKPDTQDQTVISIDAVNKYYVNAIPVSKDDLVPRVQTALEDKKEKIVYLKGDKDARYSAIMETMDALRKARIENVALITERKMKPGETAGGQ
jgi:biopolymer transport protein TolR